MYFKLDLNKTQSDSSVPCLRSKFLNRTQTQVNVSNLVQNESESDSDDDDINALFVIDKTPNPGDKDLFKSSSIKSASNEIKFSSELRPKIDTSGYFKQKSSIEAMRLVDEMTIDENSDELREKMVISTGFEHSDFYRESKIEAKRRRKLERERTKGDQWFNLPSTELSEEKKHDLTLLQMRHVWDRKRFYKKSEWKELPKYFQVATVSDSAADFYADRVPNRERKSTLVEELLQDAEFKKWSKQKYVEALKNNPYYLRMARKKKKRNEYLKVLKKEKEKGEKAKSDKGAKKHAKRLKKSK